MQTETSPSIDLSQQVVGTWRMLSWKRTLVPPASVGRVANTIKRLRAVEEAMSTSGKVIVERDGRTYAATYTVEGDMVHVKTHTETRSVALGSKRPEEITRRELKEIVEASRRH